ncbi:MAG TPA: amino acid adenylation domain-containing protein [Pyrinomonadaceae bacterium]|nr:amino acid adenylation domain-containing protein [Pyrinomonadaceae bacterium]
MQGFPLSPQQKHLWQLQDESHAYALHYTCRITGRLDVSRFREALRQVVARHEILRTRFHRVPGVRIPLQVISSDAEATLEVSEMNGLEEAGRAAAVSEAMRLQKEQPFDFERGALFRSRLLVLSTEESILLLSLSALCADSQTVRNLVREIASAYEASLRGETLSDEPIQYVDVSEVLNELLEDEDTQRGKEHWRRKDLSGLHRMEIPFEHRSARDDGFDPASVSLSLSPSVAQRMTALAEEHEMTLAALLFSCWQVLLWRLTSQSDLTVGFVYDGRMYEGLEEALGPLAKYLPVQGHLEYDAPFLTVAAQAHQAIGDNIEWQDYFDWDAVSGADGASPALNFFPVSFDFAEASPTYAAGGAQFSLHEDYACIDRFKLKLSCTLQGDTLEAALYYDASLFSDEDMSAMAEMFKTIAESAARRPEAQIGSLDIASESMHRRLASALNSTQAEYASEQSVHRLFERQAARVPERLAVVGEGQRLTFAELNARANQLARYLRRLGVRTEERVGMYTERSTEMIVALLGILKAGAAYVPLDLMSPQERLAFSLDDAGVSVVLTQNDLTERLPQSDAKVVRLDADWRDVARESAENLGLEVAPDNAAYVIYTSGSTGNPKGVAVSHRSLSNYTQFICERLRLLEATRDEALQFATVSSISADLGNTSIFPSLVSGGCLHVLSYETATDGEKFERYCAQHSIDVLKIVPSHLNALMLSQKGRSVLPRRYLILGGESFPQALAQRISEMAPTCEVLNHYGPTETTVGALTYGLDGQPERPWNSSTIPIGRPIANARVYILDPQLKLMPVGVPGELYIGGAGLARGYVNRPDLTAERFIPDPFSDQPGARMYRTGDLARYMPDENIEFLGRVDYQVKIRGYRIELGEIESALRQHPSVSDAVVMAREDEQGNKRLIAYVADSPEATPTVAELRQFAQDKLPEYMVPSEYVVLHEFPLTRNGKVDREALSAISPTVSASETPFVEPVTVIERQLASIWSQVLRVKQVGVHDNFFELGGDSILAIQIIAKASDAGIRLTPKQIFQHRTIAELAEVAGAAPAVRAEQGVVTGEVPLTPILYRFIEHDLTDLHHFNQAVFLQLRQALDVASLREAVRRLPLHHDALRLRLVQEDSRWRQYQAAPDDVVPFARVDLSEIPKTEQKRVLEAAANQVQRSFDLSTGPLMRVVLFHLGEGEPERLLIVIHHLGVDIVSWQILLADLWQAYEQLSQGRSLDLPPKTTSFKQWAERLTQYAQSEELERELEFWTSAPNQPIAHLPLDFEGRANTEVSAHNISVSLTEEETKQILQEVPKSYRTQINDVLLAALARSMNRWTGGGALLVDLEGHGREPLFDDIDLTRTVGWFTSIYPVLLEIEEGDIGASLKMVKERLRAVPGGGIGYGLLRYVRGDAGIAEKIKSRGEAEVVFNYGGQFDQSLPESSPFSLAKESTGAARSLRSNRHYLLNINGMIMEGRLTLYWTYSENLHRRETIERVAAGMMEELRAIIAHCRGLETAAYTPSDFPQMNFNQAELDDLVAELSQSLGDDQ